MILEPLYQKRRFVLLRHQTPSDSERSSHLDLMLEHNGILVTWAIDGIPSNTDRINACRLPDHRIEYLHYEGAISENRGTVGRIDAGCYELLSADCGSMSIRFAGDLLVGSLKFLLPEQDHCCWVIVRLDDLASL